ncbi:hypothetical protein SLS60_009163 [Paraconiothyrium brasiliense]|uniref:Uncharacterized protein n=1 Tax=Paraconiothyrium brasiliense TaxID=300254 RepID=A0ABR3QWI2_9PLEO
MSALKLKNFAKPDAAPGRQAARTSDHGAFPKTPIKSIVSWIPLIAGCSVPLFIWSKTFWNATAPITSKE